QPRNNMAPEKYVPTRKRHRKIHGSCDVWSVDHGAAQQFDRTAGIVFGEGAAAVDFHGSVTDAEIPGDHLVLLSRHRMQEHLTLASCQRRGWSRQIAQEIGVS